MPVVHNDDNHCRGKDDNSDGEGDQEEMGDHLSPTHDSDKGGSSDGDSSSSDSGSEDSSEMDEEECENRRTECLDDMIDLEKQFSFLKEQLYQERITQIEKKLQEVMSEQAVEYLGPLAELREAVSVRTQVAGVLRQLRLENIQNKAIAEDVAASQDFESRKALLMDSIKESLNEKIRRLEEDRNQVGLLDCDSFLNKSRPLHGGLGGLVAAFRGDGKESKDRDKRRKPITVTGPYIVYMLSEADIMEDWTLIRKALSASKRKDYPL